MSERVAALEQQQLQPVLRTISVPSWINKTRHRSATDTVLSWLNAARRSGGTPHSQDDTGRPSCFPIDPWLLEQKLE